VRARFVNPLVKTFVNTFVGLIHRAKNLVLVRLPAVLLFRKVRDSDREVRDSDIKVRENA
jgi:hypothetical protein